MAELERVPAECATPQVHRLNVQIQPMPFKSLKEEMDPMAISCTQLTFEKEQPKQEKSMSIQELVAKYTNENENMVEIHFKRQQESLSKENLSYNEEITSRGNEEHEKLQRVENDAQILGTLVVKEDELTFPKSHEKTNDEVVKTILEMATWGKMHEEFKNEKMTSILKAEECTIQLFEEVEATIVNKKIENKKIMLLEDYVLMLLIEHKYRLLEKD